MSFLSKILLLCSVAIFFSFKPSKQNKLTIQFKNYAGNAILNLDSMYANELGQKFTPSNFKYYIGNISFQQSDGKSFSSHDYFLVNEREDDSKQITLGGVPDGIYTSIEFIIGVDSLHNCSGIQSGTLDPANGMFWSWNTGYIFMKLEGRYFNAQNESNVFEYHIGGFKKPANCIRKVHIDFKGANLALQKSASTLYLKTDMLQVLKQPKSIDFIILPSVTDFHNATLIADNYMDMFSFLDVKNEK